jgi:hypothetical protein
MADFTLSGAPVGDPFADFAAKQKFLADAMRNNAAPVAAPAQKAAGRAAPVQPTWEEMNPAPARPPKYEQLDGSYRNLPGEADADSRARQAEVSRRHHEYMKYHGELMDWEGKRLANEVYQNTLKRTRNPKEAQREYERVSRDNSIDRLSEAVGPQKAEAARTRALIGHLLDNAATGR